MNETANVVLKNGDAVYDLTEVDDNFERAKAIATIIIVAIVNVANVLGYALDAEAWLNVALSILSAASIIYTWWKNQNITREAVQAQLLLNALKKANKEAKHLAKAA